MGESCSVLQDPPEHWRVFQCRPGELQKPALRNELLALPTFSDLFLPSFVFLPRQPSSALFRVETDARRLKLEDMECQAFFVTFLKFASKADPAHCLEYQADRPYEVVEKVS